MTAAKPWGEHTASLRVAAFPVDGCAGGLDAFTSPDCAQSVDGHLAGQVGEEVAVKAYEEAALVSATAVHRIVAEQDFRTAVEGRDAMLDRALGNLVESGVDGPRNRAFRRDAELVTKYWQRYCTQTEFGATRPAGFRQQPERVVALPEGTMAFGPILLEELEPVFAAAGRRSGVSVQLCAASLDELNAGEYLAVLDEPVPVGASGAHTPRATEGRVVLHREAWHTTIADTGLAEVVGPRERYFAVRRWRAELGLPERVFVALADGSKPLYVDFTSPIFTALLCTALRACTDQEVAVTITEVLPGSRHAWVTDAQGAHYVSELLIT